MVATPTTWIEQQKLTSGEFLFQSIFARSSCFLGLPSCRVPYVTLALKSTTLQRSPNRLRYSHGRPTQVAPQGQHAPLTRAAVGPGCVKTQNPDIFKCLLTMPDYEKTS
jgi:hypothetical protein